MDAVLVFTGRSVSQILEEGGSRSWVLDARRARRCAYVICTQNRYNDVHRSGDAPHASAFLVGRIADIVTSVEDPDRYDIRFSEYATLDVPIANVWQGWRNPVKYVDFDEVGIDVTKLRFRKLSDIPREPVVDHVPAESTAPGALSQAAPLSIQSAKRGLAAYFNVSVDAIEITIRG